jgi:hypothetical protein
LAALAALVVVLAAPAAAGALIMPPTTVAGPATDVLDFGGVAMGPDGSGGVVYTKVVDGVPHIFASRFVEGRWSGPLRVDGENAFEATQPRIAAGPRGELLVVWVSGVATVEKKIRYGLFAARIGRSASSFGPAEVVDPNVAEGVGVDASVSGTRSGQAIVAYRVITYNFNGNSAANATAVQLRPGDVLAEFRLARLRGNRWSRLGSVNVNPEASTRPPSETNGPQVLTNAEGAAAVAWQEPDQSGAARIWVRRVFSGSLGPILEASPSTWSGRPVSADADAFSLALTPYNQVRVAFRMANTPGSPLAGRMLVNTLPKGTAVEAAKLTGAVLADGAGPTAAPFVGLGPPSVAAADPGGTEGAMRLDFLAGSQLVQTAVDAKGAVVPAPTPLSAPGVPGAAVVSAIDPEGGAVVAYPAQAAFGATALALRQEFASGAVQTGLVSGPLGGPIDELAIGRSANGDSLVAFRQGEPGRFQIVVDRVSVPPAALTVEAAKKWTRPGAVKLRWNAAVSSVGGIRYSVLLNGGTVGGGLRRLSYRPRRGQLGNGLVSARILATDSLGQQVLSKPVQLKVDGEPPTVAVEAKPKLRVDLRVADPLSGVRRATVHWGDGDSSGLKGRKAHKFSRPGRYRIAVQAIDKAGNRVHRSFEVKLP